eukprot:TRINITY_DN1157_c1_g2_i1.p1 TRINITY_DN1157_c1_g2~~TRINITY_DN1157_c1_g2_i1.p1  ORF type:complete len:244 (-),score=74.31 TRINITY_DN1157_c1_g2_i1:462-1193(-)
MKQSPALMGKKMSQLFGPNRSAVNTSIYEKYQFSMFKGIFSKLEVLSNSSKGIRIVGYDKAGNKYMEVPDEREGYPPSRQVEYAQTPFDPNTVPVLWWGWLRYTTNKIPSMEDLDRFDYDQKMLKFKVAELEKADAKLRLEQMAQQQRDAQNSSGGGPDLNYLHDHFMSKIKTDGGVGKSNISPNTSKLGHDPSKSQPQNQQQQQQQQQEKPSTSTSSTTTTSTTPKGSTNSNYGGSINHDDL